MNINIQERDSQQVISYPALFREKETRAVAIVIKTPDGLGLPSKPYMGMIIDEGDGLWKEGEFIFLEDDNEDWYCMLKGSAITLTQE